MQFIIGDPGKNKTDYSKCCAVSYIVRTWYYTVHIVKGQERPLSRAKRRPSPCALEKEMLSSLGVLPFTPQGSLTLYTYPLEEDLAL